MNIFIPRSILWIYRTNQEAFMKQTDEELTNSDVQNDGSYFSRIPIEYGIHCWCYFSEMIFPTLYEVVFQNSLLILIIIRIQKMIYYVNDQKYFFCLEFPFIRTTRKKIKCLNQTHLNHQSDMNINRVCHRYPTCPIPECNHENTSLFFPWSFSSD